LNAPLLDFRLFSNLNFLGANLAGIASYILLFAWLLVFGLYLQHVYGFSPLLAGLAYLPFSILFAVSSNLVGRKLNQLGGKRVVIGGSFIAAIAVLLMSFISVNMPYWQIGIMFALFGVGVACLMAPTAVLGMRGIPKEKMGIASGVILMLRWLGGAVSVAIFSAIYQGEFLRMTHHYQLNVQQAYTYALSISMIVLFIIALASMVTSFLFIDN
jgi:MFS family permease